MTETSNDNTFTGKLYNVGDKLDKVYCQLEEKINSVLLKSPSPADSETGLSPTTKSYDYARIANVWATIRDYWTCNEPPVIELAVSDLDFALDFLRFSNDCGTGGMVFEPVDAEKFPEDVSALKVRLDNLTDGKYADAILVFVNRFGSPTWYKELVDLMLEYVGKHFAVLYVGDTEPTESERSTGE